MLWTYSKCHSDCRWHHDSGEKPDHKDHDQALTSLLEIARHCNVWLNYEKLQYKQLEVEFFGETYTVDGCKRAKGKVQAIVEMPAPSCIKEVQSFIGMINYLSKFSARLSELAFPIRELAKEKVAFNLGPEHQAAFKLVKKEIAVAPTLAYYDPKKTTVLQTDASINGLGACLLQDEKPIYFTSEALMEAQRGICCYWAWVPSYRLGYGKVSPLSVWQSLPAWNWPKALGDHAIKKLESGYTQIAKDTHQNISLQFQCVLPARLNKPASILLVQSRRTSRFYQATQGEHIPNYKPTQCKKWHFTTIAWSYTSWWYPCHTQMYHTEGVAKWHKRAPKRNTSILAIWGGNDHWRWTYTKRDKDSDPKP